MLPVHDCTIHLICPEMMQMLQLSESSKRRHAPGPTKIKVEYSEDTTKALTISASMIMILQTQFP